jgi:hypothetical protein
VQIEGKVSHQVNVIEAYRVMSFGNEFHMHNYNQAIKLMDFKYAKLFA